MVRKARGLQVQNGKLGWQEPTVEAPLQSDILARCWGDREKWPEDVGRSLRSEVWAGLLDIVLSQRADLSHMGWDLGSEHLRQQKEALLMLLPFLMKHQGLVCPPALAACLGMQE